MKISREVNAQRARQAEARARERAVIDEYGELTRAMAPHKAGMARLAVLASTIRGRFKDSDPYSDFECAGDYYTVTLGACGLQTKIEDMQATYDALGHEAFLAHCSMTLEKLRAAAGPLFGALTVQEPTGPRPLTVQGQDELDVAA